MNTEKLFNGAPEVLPLRYLLAIESRVFRFHAQKVGKAIVSGSAPL
jgi:hypothetical protein